MTRYDILGTQLSGSVLKCLCARVFRKRGGSGKTTLSLHLAVAAHIAGYETAIIDLDPQGTAEAWGGWRKDVPPLVISAKASSMTKTIDRTREAGADIAFIDTPPLAQADASTAARAADLVLVPCRPRAFDLDAIRLTASLVEMTKTTAFAVFNAGHPSTRSGYDELTEIVEALGLTVAPVRMAHRAPYHLATMTGQTAQEIEPSGKAAEEITALWAWLCQQVRMPTHKCVGIKVRQRT